MYQVAVCEDEEETREGLCAMLREILERRGVPGRILDYSSAEELSRAMVSGEHFDLLCLDIVMEGRSGMELAREVREYDDQVSILFVTGSEDHLREGYSVRPIQYLFKPIRREERERAVETDLRLYHPPRNLTLRSGGRAVVIPLSEIVYFESRNHALEVWTRDGVQNFWLSLSDVEKLLPPGRFCRSHVSYLVNLDYVEQVGRKEVLLSNGTRIPISRANYETFQERLIRFLNQK